MDVTHVPRPILDRISKTAYVNGKSPPLLSRPPVTTSDVDEETYEPSIEPDLTRDTGARTHLENLGYL